MSEDIVKYYVFAGLIPPEGVNKETVGMEKEVDKVNFESIEKQMLERKDKIIFRDLETKRPILLSTTYPVIYIQTRIQKIPANLYVPTGQGMKIQ